MNQDMSLSFLPSDSVCSNFEMIFTEKRCVNDASAGKLEDHNIGLVDGKEYGFLGFLQQDWLVLCGLDVRCKG